MEDHIIGHPVRLSTAKPKVVPITLASSLKLLLGMMNLFPAASNFGISVQMEIQISLVYPPTSTYLYYRQNYKWILMDTTIINNR